MSELNTLKLTKLPINFIQDAHSIGTFLSHSSAKLTSSFHLSSSNIKIQVFSKNYEHM